MNAKYRVDIIESERGWGRKLDEQRDFDTLEEAKAFVEKHNAQNNEPTVPDIYWRAEPPRLVDIDVSGPPKK